MDRCQHDVRVTVDRPKFAYCRKCGTVHPMPTCRICGATERDIKVGEVGYGFHKRKEPTCYSCLNWIWIAGDSLEEMSRSSRAEGLRMIYGY